MKTRTIFYLSNPVRLVIYNISSQVSSIFFDKTQDIQGFENGIILDQALFIKSLNNLLKNLPDSVIIDDIYIVLSSKTIVYELKTKNLDFQKATKIKENELDKLIQSCKEDCDEKGMHMLGAFVCKLIRDDMEVTSISNTYASKIQAVLGVFSIKTSELNIILEAFTSSNINVVDIIPKEKLILEYVDQGCVISLEEFKTTIMMINKNKLLGVKHIAVGVQNLNNLIMQKLGIDRKNAQILIEKFACNCNQAAFDWIEIEKTDGFMICITNTMITELVNSYIEYLIQRIKQTVHLFQKYVGKQIIITDKGASLIDIKKAFEKQLNCSMIQTLNVLEKTPNFILTKEHKALSWWKKLKIFLGL